MPRKYERKVGGGPPLLAGDIFQMMGLPSIGYSSMPLENIFNSVMGPGAFTNLRNTGTKMLLDNVLKGVVGKGRRRVGGAGPTLQEKINYLIENRHVLYANPYYGNHHQTIDQFLGQHQDGHLYNTLSQNEQYHVLEQVDELTRAIAQSQRPALSPPPSPPARPLPSSPSPSPPPSPAYSGEYMTDPFSGYSDYSSDDYEGAGRPRKNHQAAISRIHAAAKTKIEKLDDKITAKTTKKQRDAIEKKIKKIQHDALQKVDLHRQMAAASAASSVCKHKYPNKCKCPKMHGAGIFDMFKNYTNELDLPGTGKKLANSALEILMKRALAGGSQPFDAPLMMGPRLVGGHWYDYINPAWYFKKTMQKVVEPVLHATKLDKVVGAIPGVNMVAAMTGAIKPPGMPSAPPAAAAPAKAGAGRRRRRRGGAGLVDDLEGGAIPDFEEMSLTKLRQLYKALEQQPQLSKEQLIGAIEPYFEADAAPRRRRVARTPSSRSPSPSPAPAPAPKKAPKKQDAAYYRERYARRKAQRQGETVKEI